MRTLIDPNSSCGFCGGYDLGTRCESCGAGSDNYDALGGEEEYDVVIDALQEKRDRLWKMTQSNMNADMMNIMDDIRLQQISELERAITLWKKSKE
jgi:hypothetical protein